MKIYSAWSNISGEHSPFFPVHVVLQFSMHLLTETVHIRRGCSRSQWQKLFGYSESGNIGGIESGNNKPVSVESKECFMFCYTYITTPEIFLVTLMPKFGELWTCTSYNKSEAANDLGVVRLAVSRHNFFHLVFSCFFNVDDG